jgi:hypothetical protein
MKMNLLAKALFVAIVALPVSPQVFAEATSLGGKWYVLPDGKSKITILTLSQSGDQITGIWAPDKGAPSEILNAKIAGDTLTFSFLYDKKEFSATGHLSGGTMTFDISGPEKWGKSKTIHAKAERGDMQ